MIKDICHMIMLHADARDIVNTYLGLHPYHDIIYYIDRLMRVLRRNKQTVYYIPYRSCDYIQNIWRIDIMDGRLYYEVTINNGGYEVMSKNWYSYYTPYGVVYRKDGPAIIDDGDERWYKNGKLHRDNDEPAVIYKSGGKVWYKNGLIHRDNNMPAIITHDGSKQWYYENYLHRDNDQPAVIDSDGNMRWYRRGLLHRDGGLPAYIDSDGEQRWYVNGQRIR